MSLQSYVGSFTIPASGTLGDHVVSGIVDNHSAAFTPKCIIIFGRADGKWNDGLTMDEMNSYGFDDTVTHFSAYVESRWFAAIPWRGAGSSPNYSILTGQAIFASGFRLKGYVKTFASGQFTYTLDANPDGGEVLYYMVLGGSALTAKVLTSVFAGTGAKTQTGAGFTPKAGIFVSNSSGAFNDVNGTYMNVGWCDTALNQYAMCSSLIENQNPSKAYRSLHSGVVVLQNNNNTPAANNAITVTAWNSDGFTFNATTSTPFGCLLLGGPDFIAGTYNQPTTTDIVDISAGVNKRPFFIMFGSVGAVTTATIATNESFSIGVYDGTRQKSYWNGSLNGATLAGDGGSNWGASSALVIAQANGLLSSTLIEKGILTGVRLDYGGFHGSFTNTDLVARQIIYLMSTETAVPLVGSGVYQIVPDQTHDETYTAYSPVTTTNVAIPDPSADVFLLGDE